MPKTPTRGVSARATRLAAAAAVPASSLITDHELAAVTRRVAARMPTTHPIAPVRGISKGAAAHVAVGALRSGLALDDTVTALRSAVARMPDAESALGRTAQMRARSVLMLNAPSWDALAAAFTGTHTELMVRGTEDRPRLGVESVLLAGGERVFCAAAGGEGAHERARRMLAVIRGMRSQTQLVLEHLIGSWLEPRRPALTSCSLGWLCRNFDFVAEHAAVAAPPGSEQ